MDSTLVATLDLIAVRFTGDSAPIGMRVWLPRQEPTGEWLCQLELPGLCEHLIPIRGEDSVHAICLALAFAERFLRETRDSGVRLEFSSGGAFPLERYFGYAPS